jgi:hypothetical protein
MEYAYQKFFVGAPSQTIYAAEARGAEADNGVIAPSMHCREYR